MARGPGDKATPKVRKLIPGTRGWLGVNPRTGREYLPPNPGEARGGLYLIDGVVCNVELFRRLRIRAAARGADGMPDLRAALDLVNGMPFEGQRPGVAAARRRGGVLIVVDAQRHLLSPRPGAVVLCSR